MNVYDSDKMLDILGENGYSAINNPDDADLVILNTCHIREKAGEKVYSDLGRIRKIKANKNLAGKEMIVYEDERWTYREAYEFSSAFANSLINDFGVKRSMS